jgi:hypothetical protein
MKAQGEIIMIQWVRKDGKPREDGNMDQDGWKNKKTQTSKKKETGECNVPSGRNANIGGEVHGGQTGWNKLSCAEQHSRFSLNFPLIFPKRISHKSHSAHFEVLFPTDVVSHLHFKDLYNVVWSSKLKFKISGCGDIPFLTF